MTYQTLQLSYLIRKHKKRKDGTVPIYLRIGMGGKRVEISASRTIAPEKWDPDRKKVKGRTPEVKSINSYLDTLKANVYDAHRQLLQEGEEISAKAIKRRLTGKDKKSHAVVDVFTKHNEKMKSLVGMDFAKGTYKRYCTCLNHIKDFLSQEYDMEYPVDKVDLEFIEAFEYYLKTKKNPCGHNSALKYVFNFKKIVHLAMRKKWLDEDPFLEYDKTLQKKSPTCLSQDELERIESTELESERLRRIRDVFVFRCYTGLAYSDACRVDGNHIKYNNEGKPYLDVKRVKTDKQAIIPLLPKAMEIIKKYHDDPETADGRLLPTISNQKTNEYLKEVATLAGVDKKLTTHVARHTCATTVMLANEVPVETVQKILGHSKLSTTMHYARVAGSKIHKDINKLQKRLAS
ncbi:site-specific integrase [Fodinibius sediminis]|uniref:Site-specific recombinase XerD n=1 Tax=Fodinibius sediminis TaxID=1214077 RepID=A0A521D7S6_9BACT|nr:site-specific integrase [Fodinibius sediminis]SMO66950.1 Site-specific recombinase XerD [Fodinibius sediminis]